MMVPVIRFHEKAKAEYIDAFVWYESKQPGLGERFMRQVEKRLTLILQDPFRYAAKAETRFREIKVQDFPYLIVYEIFEKESFIHIAAIIHGKRNPRKRYRKL